MKITMKIMREMAYGAIKEWAEGKYSKNEIDQIEAISKDITSLVLDFSEELKKLMDLLPVNAHTPDFKKKMLSTLICYALENYFSDASEDEITKFFGESIALYLYGSGRRGK